MNKKDLFFAKPFSEKRFVNVLVSQSNIKSKKGTYYGRVCKTGRVGSEELLNRLKEASPYIDINMMRAGMEKMMDIIVDLVASGKTVDFFNLGTFSLFCEGAIEVEPAMQSYIDNRYDECENADFDVSKAVKKEPKFALKFEPSLACKKTYENVKMAFALKKRRAPQIEKIENALPDATTEATEGQVSIIRVSGENLKIAGEKEEIGVYIREENGEEIKIKRENIIQNTPKMLVILLHKRLKKDASYTLSIQTQYSRVGSSCTTSIIRKGSKEFVWECTQAEEAMIKGCEEKAAIRMTKEIATLKTKRNDKQLCSRLGTFRVTRLQKSALPFVLSKMFVYKYLQKRIRVLKVQI